MKKKWIWIAVVLMMFVLMYAYQSVQNKMEEKEQPLPIVSEETVLAEADETAGEREDNMKQIIENQTFPVLYYGKILEIKGTAEEPSQLIMDSPKYGEWIMNLGEPTCYINSGERKAFEASELQVGDSVYVFHSTVSTMSLPPQSPAYVVVKNIPMDAGCPMHHRVKKITEEDGSLILNVSGGKILKLSPEDHLLSYDGLDLEHNKLQEGDRIMGWYWDQGEKVIRASHLMILPDVVKK